jgi:hypothetical protein
VEVTSGGDGSLVFGGIGKGDFLILQQLPFKCFIRRHSLATRTPFPHRIRGTLRAFKHVVSITGTAANGRVMASHQATIMKVLDRRGAGCLSASCRRGCLCRPLVRRHQESTSPSRRVSEGGEATPQEHRRRVRRWRREVTAKRKGASLEIEEGGSALGATGEGGSAWCTSVAVEHVGSAWCASVAMEEGGSA